MFLAHPWADEYFHWMLESLPRLGAFLRSAGATRPADRILVRSLKSFHRETVGSLGVDPERLLSIADTGPHVAADELVTIEGLEIAPPSLSVHPWAVHVLRNALLSRVDRSTQFPKRLYLARHHGHGRRVVNEEQLAPLLERFGVETVYPEKHSVLQQAAMFAGAQLVIAPVGAALVNLAFCSPGTDVLIFYPAGTPWRIYWEMCAIVRARHHHLKCEPPSTVGTRPDWVINGNADMLVPDDAVERFLRQTA